MNDETPAPLDPEPARLVAAERERGDAPVDAQREVLARLEAILGGGGAPPSAGSSSSGSPSPAKGFLGRAQRFAPARAGAIALATLVGAVGGALLRGAAAPTLVYVDRPIASSVSSAASAGVPEAPPPPLLSAFALPRAPRPAPTLRPPASVEVGFTGQDHDSRSTKARDTSLAGERALVETGRMALARGDHASALDAFSRHASTFPSGQLSEEREVLAIQTLARSDRRQEAAERAARFRLQHPDSVLLAVVDEALR